MIIREMNKNRVGDFCHECCVLKNYLLFFVVGQRSNQLPIKLFHIESNDFKAVSLVRFSLNIIECVKEENEMVFIIVEEIGREHNALCFNKLQVKLLNKSEMFNFDIVVVSEVSFDYLSLAYYFEVNE